MKAISVEWKHLDVAGNTCERCSNTGAELIEIISRLNRECNEKGVEVIFKETKLAEQEIEESNLILINGKPIENLLPDAQASKSCCPSCGELTGKEEACRTIVQFGKVYESIPQQLVRKAICEVAQCCQSDR